MIFKYPSSDNDDIYNKRLCAIEGDEVAEKYGFEKSIMPDGDFVEEVVGNGDKDNFGPTTVPKEMMLMLGDSRDNSFDSRFWGFCPVENFRGKVIGIF